MNRNRGPKIFSTCQANKHPDWIRRIKTNGKGYRHRRKYGPKQVDLLERYWCLVHKKKFIAEYLGL